MRFQTEKVNLLKRMKREMVIMGVLKRLLMRLRSQVEKNNFFCKFVFCIFSSLSLSLPPSFCVCLSVCVWMCVWVCVWVCVNVYVDVWMCGCVCESEREEEKE